MRPDEIEEPHALEHHAQRAQLEQYLLGTLDEDARRVLQDEMSRDPELSAALRAVEIDLLDAAVRGALDPERQQLVEAYLAAAARNGNAWVLAQALIERESRAGEQARDAREARRAGRPGPATGSESDSDGNANARRADAPRADSRRTEGRRADVPVTRSHRVLFLVAVVVLMAIAGLSWTLRGCG